MATSRTPRVPYEWKKMAEEKGITSLSIHNEELPSASKIKLRQFLLLRVLWKEIQPAGFKPSKFGLDRYIQQAKKMLKGYRSWNSYCASFDSSEREEGNFFLAKLFQEDTKKVESNDVGANIFISPISKRTRGKTREKDGAKDTSDDPYSTPTKSSWTDRIENLHLVDESQMIEDFSGDNLWSPWNMVKKDTPGSQEWNDTTPKSQDEQIVNTALINFLKAITAHFPVLSDWSIHRKALAAKFASTEYEARLDGYLRGKVHGEIRGLIEVKSAARKQKSFEVRMQESAQMVAWLLHSPEIPRSLPGRRFHTSQDRNEIWLSFAKYDENYLKYLKGEHVADDPLSFMSMFEVGPYEIGDRSRMMAVAPIILALVLRADDDRKAEEGKKII